MNNGNQPPVEDSVPSGGPPDGSEPSGELVPEDEELARFDRLVTVAECPQ